ncbi:BrnT family toxin [bacterium]|nr:BrnT family toxin [bacterium]
MFEWDEVKNRENQSKHGADFEEAEKAFTDPQRVIVEDLDHSFKEERWFCLGNVEGNILTVRFTYRGKIIRIIGAGYWRKGKKRYEKENKIHK